MVGSEITKSGSLLQFYQEGSEQFPRDYNFALRGRRKSAGDLGGLHSEVYKAVGVRKQRRPGKLTVETKAEE